MMLSFALGTLFKVTLILGLGALIERLWHNRGAELRHAALASAVIGALIIPFMSAFLPPWRAPVSWLPSEIVLDISTERTTRPKSAAIASNSAAPVATSDNSTSRRYLTLGTTFGTAERVKLVVASIWIAGVALVLGLLFSGQLALQRMRRRARPAEGMHWSNLVRRAAADMGVRSHVSLLLSPDVAVPLTYGIVRPVLLFPTSSDSWTDDRKRLVLVHELAHLRRRDAPIEWAAWIACALYWFHPLVWYVARRVRVQRELACDDMVVRATGNSIAYATQLVEIAAAVRLSRAHPVAALAMAARGSLEMRVRALLDRRRTRGALSLRARLCLGFASAAVVSLLAVLRPVAAASRDLSQTPAAARDTLEWSMVPNGSVEWRGAVRAGDTVTIRAAMGNVVVDSGAPDVVTLSARRLVGPRGATADTRVNVFRTGRTIVICSAHFSAGRRIAPCEVNDDWGRGSVDDNSVSFDVSVPAGVHVILMTGLGDLTTSRLRGDVRALTGNGVASIENNGAADVEAYSGGIRMRVLGDGQPAPLALRVKHGGIDVELAPNEGALIDAAVDSGSVFVNGATRASSTDARRFVGAVGAGRRPLRATLQKGVININTASG